VNSQDEEIDATFRKSLLFMQGKNRSVMAHTCSPVSLSDTIRWIVLLAYGEFVTNRIRDMLRGEEIFWEAARFFPFFSAASAQLNIRLAISYSAWSTIALIHHYQYMVDDLREANRVFLWAAKCRDISDRSNQSHRKIDEEDQSEFESSLTDQGPFLVHLSLSFSLLFSLSFSL
jgi:VanZ family protein